MRERRHTIVGIGEAQYDVYPQTEVVGGSPLNVAIFVQQLGERFDAEGLLVSRIGQDNPGTRLTKTICEHGVSTQLLQSDPDYPTGRVYVDVEADGSRRYDIVENVAWDVLQYDFDLEDLARQCHAICYGSLAQRTGQSRNTIYRFLDEARRTIKLFDVNLRPPFWDRHVLERSCERATMVKLTHEEMSVVLRALHLRPQGEGLAAGCEALQKAFDLDWVVVTRGSLGSAIFNEAGFHEGEIASYEHDADATDFSASDGVAAAVLLGRLLQRPASQVADFANHVSAYIASKPGAWPKMPDEIVNIIA